MVVKNCTFCNVKIDGVNCKNDRNICNNCYNKNSKIYNNNENKKSLMTL